MGAVTRGDATLLAAAARHARPVALAVDQMLPIHPALAPLLPEPGLRRGTVVGVHGVAATSLALVLAAAPSAAGSWVGVLGLPGLGLLAAAEAGVALERLLLVAAPPLDTWPTVAATLLDGVDVVLARSPRGVRGADVRRLQARVRERGAVVCLVGASEPFEVDVTLTAVTATWHGLEQGAGHLRARQITVEAAGRRASSRPRRAALWLPDEGGTVELAVTPAAVVPFRGAS
jgi:hypothetical protein